MEKYENEEGKIRLAKTKTSRTLTREKVRANDIKQVGNRIEYICHTNTLTQHRTQKTTRKQKPSRPTTTSASSSSSFQNPFTQQKRAKDA